MKSSHHAQPFEKAPKLDSPHRVSHAHLNSVQTTYPLQYIVNDLSRPMAKSPTSTILLVLNALLQDLFKLSQK